MTASEWLFHLPLNFNLIDLHTCTHLYFTKIGKYVYDTHPTNYIPLNFLLVAILKLLKLCMVVPKLFQCS